MPKYKLLRGKRIKLRRTGRSKRMTVSKVKKIIRKNEMMKNESIKIERYTVNAPSTAALGTTPVLWGEVDYPLTNGDAHFEQFFVKSLPNTLNTQTANNLWTPPDPIPCLQGTKCYRKNLKIRLRCVTSWWSNSGPGWVANNNGAPFEYYASLFDPQNNNYTNALPVSMTLNAEVLCAVRILVLRRKKDRSDQELVNYIQQGLASGSAFDENINSTIAVAAYDKRFNLKPGQRFINVRLKPKAQRQSRIYPVNRTTGKTDIGGYLIPDGKLYFVILQQYQNFKDGLGTNWTCRPIFTLDITEWLRP